MTGILEIPSDQYHADEVADQPSLSSSIAKLLISSSPLHAWTQHPRLNPAYARHDDEKFDVGTAAHALILEGRNAVEVIEGYDNWKTNAAKEARAAARAAGKIPMLSKDWEACTWMVQAVRDQVDALDITPPLFTDGKSEQTLVWEEEGVTCRARLDWLRDDGAAIDDLKTTSRSANPEQFTRTLFSMGYDVQAAFYLRGLAAVAGAAVGGMADFRFVVVETSPPYALSVLSLLPAALELANDKVTWAIRKWRSCLESGLWPGYPVEVCWAEAPGWAESQWLEREARETA